MALQLVDPGLSSGSSSDSENEDMIVDTVRRSRELARYSLDARKQTEYAGGPGDQMTIPLEKLRKSIDLHNQRPTAVHIAADESSTSGHEARPRKSLEETFDEKDEEAMLRTFPISEGLTSAEAALRLKEFGKNELPDSQTPLWLKFLKMLIQPLPAMIWIAAIVELGIGNYADVGILVAINLINASLSLYEESKAGNAVAALKNSLRPLAVCKRDGEWNHKFDATQLVPGDLVELIAGAAVPADVMINHGEVEIDESAMTGESLPVVKTSRTLAKMGGTVARGETEATVVFTGPNTFFGKTAQMLGGDKGQSNMQKLLILIMKILVGLSLLLCGTALIYLLATGEGVKESLSFAVVVLVASIPMAIEIVVLVTLALGSRQMSAFGAIVSRLTAIEDLAGMNMLCSDKTGTLTKNKMMIQPQAPIFMPGVSQMDLLKWSAMAAKWESPPKDALDTLVLRCPLWDTTIDKSQNPGTTPEERERWEHEHYERGLLAALQDYERLDFMPFDPRFKRTESTIRQKSTGVIFKVTKGAPHVIAALDSDQEKGQEVHETQTAFGEDGVRCMAIAISEPLAHFVEGGENPVVWHLQGMLTFLDPPRDDTKDTIERAERYGVPVRMITGDHLTIAKKTCRDLEMGDRSHPNWPTIQGPSELPRLDADGKAPPNLKKNYGQYIEQADGFAQVFPEHKFLIVECYKQLGYKTGMTGDGVNDAPALKAADVGIAVAGATDAARAAAAIVLTEEGLSTIIHGMEVARAIFRRMKSFLTYRIAATLQLLFFFFIALYAFKPRVYLPDPVPLAAHAYQWPNFFSLPVLMLMIITILNDGTLCCIGYDNAVASPFPERWNLPAIFIASISLGVVACFSSLILLYFCLTSWQVDGLFQSWGIGGLEYGQIINVMFLKVAVTDFLTLISSRTQEDFFFTSNPSLVLWIGATIALTASTLLALLWPIGSLDHLPVYGLAYESGNLIALWIWLYCIVVFLIQDIVKVGCFWVLIRFNFFNIRGVRVETKNDENEVSMKNMVAADH